MQSIFSNHIRIKLEIIMVSYLENPQVSGNKQHTFKYSLGQ